MKKTFTPEKSKEEKPLTKDEKYVSELTWGGIPCDISFIRNSNLFKTKMKEYESRREETKEIKTSLQ